MDKVKGSNEPNPLADLKVRQALDMAVNKQQIIDSVYQGAGHWPSTPCRRPSGPTTPPSRTPSTTPKSQELLKEAGVKEGTEITLWAMPVQRPYNPNAKLMAEMLQSDWAKIGLKAKIVSYEWGEYIKRSKGGENQAMLIGWSGDNGDPDNWLNVLFGCDSLDGNNFSKWCYKPFDDIVKQAKAHLGSGQAHRAVQTGATHPQRPDSDDTYRSLDGVQPMRAVQDFKISPFGLNSFYGVSVSNKVNGDVLTSPLLYPPESRNPPTSKSSADYSSP
jgi:dipeptide transport system substrate-binding protein